MLHTLEIPKSKIRVLLHLYQDMDKDEAILYWSKNLSISRSQFSKPYVKKSLLSKLDHKGYGHGTCMLVVSDTLLREKVMMTIKSMDLYANAHILA